MATMQREATASHIRGWKACIHILLDESTTALAESFSDLGEEQLWSRPLAGRHSIGTMVMHCLESFNE